MLHNTLIHLEAIKARANKYYPVYNFMLSDIDMIEEIYE